jgi:hypothetical protein
MGKVGILRAPIPSISQTFHATTVGDQLATKIAIRIRAASKE